MPDSPKKIPFNPTRPASADVFVGRRTLKHQIVYGLQSGLCFEVIGGPGVGKTSLLLAIQHQLVASYGNQEEGLIPLPLYVDCLRKHVRIEDLIVSIINKAKECLQIQRNFTCPSDVLSRALAEGEKGRLEAALEVVLNWAYLREKRTHQIVLLLDNLHRLTSRDLIYDFISILTTMIDQQQIALVLASRQTLVKEFRNDVSPLRPLISQQLTLGMLSRQETQLLVAKAADFGWSLDDACADVAFEITNGHPYRLHYYLYGVLSADGKVTAEGLLSLHNSETIQHLNLLLQNNEGRQESSQNVFISYSHKDEKEKNLLLDHLGILQHAHSVNIWSDNKIGAGANWQIDINIAIKRAKVAILLITTNFLTSKFILEEEMPRLLHRHNDKELVIVPIIARACAWRAVEWLAEINVRPKNGKPIWSDLESHVDEDLALIAEEVASILKK
jgi:hypothetical protein